MTWYAFVAVFIGLLGAFSGVAGYFYTRGKLNGMKIATRLWAPRDSYERIYGFRETGPKSYGDTLEETVNELRSALFEEPRGRYEQGN